MLIKNADEKRLYRKTLIRPFSYTAVSVGNASVTMLILLSVQLLMLALTGSFHALLVVGAALAGALCAEYSERLFRKTYRFSGVTSAVQGIIAGMLIPSTYPPLTVFVITFVTMALAKYMFGGFANAWGNASVITAAAAWIIGMSAFPGLSVTGDILQLRNPSYTLIQTGVFPVLKFDPPITEALNNTLFGLLKISIPDGYISLLWDTQSVIPAFRFNIITILSSIVLFASGMLSMLIPVCFLAVYGLLVRFAGPMVCGGVPMQGDMLLAYLTSGTLFCAVFVIQWYGTAPLTITGKTIYGIICGILAFLIAGCGTSSEGMIFTVLAANIISPLIQAEEDRYNKKRLVKSLDRNLRMEGL